MPQQSSWSSGSSQWLVINGPRREGPYSEAYVIACLQGGSLSPCDIVSPVGTAQQKPIKEWPEFAEVVREVAATPPPLRNPIPHAWACSIS